MAKRIETDNLSCFYGGFRAVEGVSLTIEPKSVTALIGPSGCGKSTFLRSLNRMHEVIPGARVEGKVLLDDEDIYGHDVDPVAVRRIIGMVFQKPNPFPTMSIYDNVVAGLRLSGARKKSDLDAAVEKSLRGANLWNEVKDRLNKPGMGLSGGQQQRLCIARAIAVEPQVLLMDEPCSALDPISTLAIEDLMVEIKDAYTIVIVTHNMQQAARVSDTTAFFNVDGPGRARAAGRGRRDRSRSSPTRPRSAPRTTSPAASAETYHQRQRSAGSATSRGSSARPPPSRGSVPCRSGVALSVGGLMLALAPIDFAAALVARTSPTGAGCRRCWSAAGCRSRCSWSTPCRPAPASAVDRHDGLDRAAAGGADRRRRRPERPAPELGAVVRCGLVIVLQVYLVATTEGRQEPATTTAYEMPTRSPWPKVRPRSSRETRAVRR